jgi:hypothetical protein
MQHVTIYRERGRFAGWPANYGIWRWPGAGAAEDEIVVGFTLGYHRSDAAFHARDRERPFATMQARSLNGGETWEVVPFTGNTPAGRALSADEHMVDALGVGAALKDPAAPHRPVDPPGGIAFTHPDFALLCARTGLRRGVRSFFYHSNDRCHTWQGPFWLPGWGQPGIAARTDYIVDGPSACTLFLTANKQSTGEEGRVLCARTTDGGRTFALVGWVGPEPEGFAIMPAGLRLSPARLLCARRCRDAERRAWIDLYASDDDGRTWSLLATPVTFGGAGHSGNPPTLHRLADGRLVMTYGDRNGPPYRMCARLSEDAGRTWGGEITLRDDGGSHDIGYPRTVVRSDGALVTAYYWNDRPDGDGERYIAATIWRP